MQDDLSSTIDYAPQSEGFDTTRERNIEVDESGIRADGGALPEINNHDALKSPISGHMRPVQRLTRQQSLGKPSVFYGRTQATVQQAGSRQNIGVSTSSMRETTTSFAARRNRQSSATAPKNLYAPKLGKDLRRNGSSSTSHKRTQSASLDPGNHSALSNASHKRSTSNGPKTVDPANPLPHEGAVSTGGTKAKIEALTVTSKIQRPAFSTFQQHFSPKKVTGTSAASVSIDTDESCDNQYHTSVEDGRLQTELLQLHVLHQSSAGTLKDWQTSAERTLRTRFENVIIQHQKLVKSECLAQASLNQAALQEWTARGAVMAKEDHIQCLSKLLQECLLLTARHGRYDCFCETFSEWFETSETASQSTIVSFSKRLAEQWKAEHAALTRKLTSMSREADELPDQFDGFEDSSVAIISLTCKKLIRGMLDELRSMLAIEADIAARGRARIDQGLAQFEADIKIASQDLGAIWATGA